MATQSVTPNLYQLSGSGLHVTFSTTSLDGSPTLTYQDPREGKSFRGDAIRIAECDLGMLVSVSLRTTIDSGSTSLSVLIPRMRISQGEHVPVRTECVTTVHRFMIPQQLMHGQLDSYRVVPLHGTAQAVAF